MLGSRELPVNDGSEHVSLWLVDIHEGFEGGSGHTRLLIATPNGKTLPDAETALRAVGLPSSEVISIERIRRLDEYPRPRGDRHFVGLDFGDRVVLQHLEARVVDRVLSASR